MKIFIFAFVLLIAYDKLQLLILQRAEDLKDECEDILEGINISQIEIDM